MKTDTHTIKCKKVAVCLLSYNSLDFLRKFIPSILNTNYDDYTLVYIDNASEDESLAYIKQFPEIEIFRIYENHGFTGGYTGSLKYIDAEYYVLLNSDVEVDPNWLRPIIDRMDEDPKIGAAQPKTLHEPKKSQFDYGGASGGYMDKYGYTFCRGRIFNTVELDTLQYESEEEIFWATGACMIVRAELYHRLGGLDNSFYAHMEEIDLCWRIKNAGYNIKVIPKAVVYHVGGSIIKYGSYSKIFHNYRNNLVMMYKNLPSEKLFFTIFVRMILDGISAIKSLLTFQFTEFRAIFMSHISFYAQFGVWRKRREDAQQHFVSENTEGIYQRSIIWNYFVKGKKRFEELRKF